MFRRTSYVVAWSLIAAALFGGALQPFQPALSMAQGACRPFPETGKQVCGRFLEYWQANGGLAQQGLPLSQELTEVSDTDGKPYTVQYFERAVFEKYPENAAPNDVLLSLLGNFQYRLKYENAGAPNQLANTANPRTFPETGKSLGGLFRQYWEQNGGLAQQGYPISDEFLEKSELNGQTYKVQYFERAVFEWHPENQPPYDVLLSQLGTAQYKRRYLSPTATSAPPTAPPTATSMPVPPTATPVSINDCEGIPPTPAEQMHLSGTCVALWGYVKFAGRGFLEDSQVKVYSLMPNGEIFAANFLVPVKADGEALTVTLTIDEETPYFGIWKITVEGVQTGRKVNGYIKLVPYGTPLP